MTTVNAAVKILREKFPQIDGIKDAHYWDNTRYAKNEAIFLGNAAEGGTIDGLDACSFYNEDYEERIYIMGTHKKLHDALAALGFHTEAFDPGTYLAYRS